MSTRRISSEKARSLAPGSDHYTAYVGPPSDYDYMGATQFRLLCALGLRDHHRLLDFGCGSLRAGRFFIPYLLPGHYYGIEPNSWLIEEAIRKELGADQIQIKRPEFSHHDNFDCSVFGVEFDYIVAQSIFSHCGVDLVRKGLSAFAESLSPNGLAAVTFIHPDTPQEVRPADGWTYPECVGHSPESVYQLIEGASLHGQPTSWEHPRQTWWLLSRDSKRLPDADQELALMGKVLNPSK